MKATSWYTFTVLFAILSSFARAEESCGDAKILSGSSCENLRVVFQLKSCGIDRSEMAQIICKEGFPTAVFYGEKHTFSVPLRELSPGVWSVVGAPRRHPRNWSPTRQELQKKRMVFKTSPSSPLSDEEGGSIFEVGGQFRFRMEQNHKNDFTNDRGFSSVRLRTNLGFRPSDSLSFLLEPQANQILGEPGFIGATSSLNIPSATSGANRDPQLTFHRAFGELKATPSWRLLLGRQMLSYADEVLVGASDWENPGRSFDGILSRFEGKEFSWDVFSVKLWDSNTKSSGVGDKDFHGSYFSWDHPDRLFELSPYFFWLRDHRAQLQNFHLLGIHARYAFSVLEARGEVTQQWGERSGQQAWIFLESSPLGSSSPLKFGIDGFWASAGFNPLFPSTHKWLGWADVVGRRNLSGVGARALYELSGTVTLQARTIHFMKVDPGQPVFQSDSETPISDSTGPQQTLGTEADLILETRLFPSVSLMAASSLFFPGELLKASISEPWLGRFEVSLSASF